MRRKPKSLSVRVFPSPTIALGAVSSGCFPFIRAPIGRHGVFPLVSGESYPHQRIRALLDGPFPGGMGDVTGVRCVYVHRPVCLGRIRRGKKKAPRAALEGKAWAPDPPPVPTT